MWQALNYPRLNIFCKQIQIINSKCYIFLYYTSCPPFFHSDVVSQWMKSKKGLKIFVEQLRGPKKKGTREQKSYFEISDKSVALCHILAPRGSQFMSLHVIASRKQFG